MMSLTTLDLNDILFDKPVTKRFFLGTYPACMVPETNKTFYTFITNTHNHDEPGQHWNAWVVNKDNVFFFDSFGRSPKSLNYEEIIKRYKKIIYTSKCIQGVDSKACGYFCIHYLYILSLKLPLDFFLSEYSENLLKNGYVVQSIINSI